ncbi:MAG: hypothetical protein HYR85_07565 [Planctomycetes bacterium]|nr:hypothetical protein [Planctomycetota bacterium]
MNELLELAIRAAAAAAQDELGGEKRIQLDQLRDALQDELGRAGPSALQELHENMDAGLTSAAAATFLASMRLAGIRAARKIQDHDR